MAGFLSFLAPIGESLGQTMQQGQQRQQQEANRDAFGKALDTLGPDQDLIKQMYKAGASPQAIMSVAGGPLGKQLQQQHMQQQINDIMSNKDMSDIDKQMRLVGIGAMDPDKFYEMRAQEAKPKPPTLAQQQSHIGSWADSKPEGVPPGLVARAHAIANDPNANPADVEDFTKNVIPSFERYHAGGGADDTMWQQQYDPTTQTTRWVGVPKHPTLGQAGGQVTPRAGAGGPNVIAVAGAGMNQLLPMLDKLPGGSDSGQPMYGAWLKRKAGLPLSAEDNAVIDQISVVDASLVGVVMKAWGSRNSAAAERYVNIHVPQVGDSPAAIKQKIQEWMRPGGLLEQYQAMTGGPLTADQLKKLGVPASDAAQVLASPPPPTPDKADDFLNQHFGDTGD